MSLLDAAKFVRRRIESWLSFIAAVCCLSEKANARKLARKRSGLRFGLRSSVLSACQLGSMKECRCCTMGMTCAVPVLIFAQLAGSAVRVNSSVAHTYPPYPPSPPFTIFHPPRLEWSELLSGWFRVDLGVIVQVLQLEETMPSFPLAMSPRAKV